MKKCLSILLLQLFVSISFSQISVKELHCENLYNPIGVDIQQPQLSWKLNSDKRNCLQTAYEIRVGNSSTSLLKNKDLLWSSGRVTSSQSVHISYKVNALQSANKYYWQVRVWDNNGRVSTWSEPAFWQMGLLNV